MITTNTDCKKIFAFIPYQIATPEDSLLLDKSKASLVSIEHCMKIVVDGNKYPNAIAQAWNAFLDQFNGKEYDYLVITAMDVIHDPNEIDFLVKCIEEHPEVGIVTSKVTRSLEDFEKGFGQKEYTTALTSTTPKDPATILIREGVIEKVGRIDEQFPREFVERDYLYRCKLAGFEWIQPDVVLCFHPSISHTIGNPQKRLEIAFAKYFCKWGGDADQERFIYPYNDISLNLTHCAK